MAPALLLLHGFTHTGRSWQEVIAALGERYRAIAPDIRGHGAAAACTPATLEAVISDLAALAPERFALAGYSMGGRIALHAALAHPARINHLVLIGASPGIADDAERAARREADERLAAAIERSSLEEFARRWAANPVLASQPPALRERVHRDRLRNDRRGLARALRGLGTGALPALWDRLGALTMPLTLMVGERDRKFQAIAEEMAKRAPLCEVVVIGGAGHAVHLEAPERVAEAIAAARP